MHHTNLYSHAAITRRTNEWVCLPASELLPLHRPAQQLGRCVRVICAFSSSPSFFLRCHEEGHGFVGTPQSARVFPRKTRSSSPFRPAYAPTVSEANRQDFPAGRRLRVPCGSSTRFTSTRSKCPQLPPPRSFSCFAVKQIAPVPTSTLVFGGLSHDYISLILHED